MSESSLSISDFGMWISDWKNGTVNQPISILPIIDNVHSVMVHVKKN
ncbi:hypothetical protein D1BOALGB6SA_5340 [Olavius sp. associated proteobacterium Delta 1]|nr:hypothetical protein D1BOALGB6SA_5340 [Olavius sp. associated proteobacterium Delta 1]